MLKRFSLKCLSFILATIASAQATAPEITSMTCNSAGTLVIIRGTCNGTSQVKFYRDSCPGGVVIVSTTCGNDGAGKFKISHGTNTFTAGLEITPWQATGGCGDTQTIPSCDSPDCQQDGAGYSLLENFEGLNPGPVDGQGGWHGWGGTNTSFHQVSTAQNHTPGGNRSVQLVAGGDSVTELTETSGHWIITSWIYCPTGFIGKTYFTVMNSYTDLGPFEWGAQVGFNGDTGRLECDCGSTTPAQRYLIYGTWADLKIDLDLATGLTNVYYNTASDPFPIAAYPWTGGVFGQDDFAFIAIAAIDLYPDAVTYPSVTPIFVDDITIEPAGCPEPGTPVCFGDGTGTSCPCLNQGAPGRGCANGAGAGGILGSSGMASVSDDTLSLTADGVINNNGLFFQGNNTIAGGTGTVFGDGIRCCGGGVVRIQVVNPPGSTSPATAQMTEAATTNGPPGTITAGSKKCYQFWYRDPASSPCGSPFNLTNAVTVTWSS